MKVLGIIPARYGSSRLEGKPLLEINNQSMIRRVYERALQSGALHYCIVATDHTKIATECELHKIPYIMTSSQHLNGTERCGEVLTHIADNYDLIVNIQGDEPFIQPESISEIVQIFHTYPLAEIGTLIKEIENIDYLSNPSIIKVTKSQGDKALYFSRTAIPYLRDELNIQGWLTMHKYYKHIGMYAYKSSILPALTQCTPSPLEEAEKLEQLRWLEHGYSIYVAETKHESKSIDTIEDYQYILSNISKFIHE